MGNPRSMGLFSELFLRFFLKGFLDAPGEVREAPGRVLGGFRVAPGRAGGLHMEVFSDFFALLRLCTIFIDFERIFR